MKIINDVSSYGARLGYRYPMLCLVTMRSCMGSQPYTSSQGKATVVTRCAVTWMLNHHHVLEIASLLLTDHGDSIPTKMRNIQSVSTPLMTLQRSGPGAAADATYHSAKGRLADQHEPLRLHRVAGHPAFCNQLLLERISLALENKTFLPEHH